MLDKDGNVIKHCTMATCNDIPALISQAVHILVANDMLKLDPSSKLRIKLSLDGYKKSRSSRLLATLQIVDSKHPHSKDATFIIASATAHERPEDIDALMEAISGQLQKLDEGLNFHAPDGKTFKVDVELFVSADQKALLILFGLRSAASKFWCIWYVRNSLCNIHLFDSDAWKGAISTKMIETTLKNISTLVGMIMSIAVLLNKLKNTVHTLKRFSTMVDAAQRNRFMTLPWVQVKE
jgi:hypothetical protein